MAPVNKLQPQCVGFYKYHDIILGRGNFATVYLARHKVIGCEVALKVINTDDIEEEYVSRNLTREARILRDLHHPNIIRLYETVKSVNLYCLSLELIRGVNLYQYLMNQEDRRISEKLARIFFYQMLSAVKYMHHLHVIHRDLKLENILVEFGHVIKIVDFGLSNVYYPCYRLRTHCGSVEYAAPELFRSMSAYGTAADLWSLGVILYAMVVGKMPFVFSRDKSGESESARKRELFVQRISKGLMQENWELMEDLSPDCWNLLHDLLQPDQFRRIRIEDAITHHWITRDEHLKKRLPQSRKDLQRKFHPEIVNYLAHKLNTSTARIEKHINVHPNDKIACMFYIVRDILVKEVLHPPKEFESSFLYRFECWRQNKSSLFPIQQSTKIYENQTYEEYDHLTEDETTSPKSFSTSTYNVNKGNSTPSTSKIERKDSEEGKLISCLKRLDLLKPLEKSSKKLYSILSTSENAELDDNNNEDLSEETMKVTRKPYKSYKNSRPDKVNMFKDKAINNPSNLQEAFKKQLAKEKLYEEEQYLYNLEENNDEFRKEENDNVKTPAGNSLALYSNKLNKERKSKPNIEEKKFILTKTKTQLNSPLTDSVDLNKIKYKTKREYSSRILKKSKPEIVTRQMTENRISLLTRTQKSSVDLKKREAVKIDNTPSRIPVKSIRYGPPAPFSQPVNSDKLFKPRRKTVAERINLCKGDTSEKLS